MSIFSISISYFFRIFSNIPIISKEIFIDFFKEQVFYFHVVESIGTFLHSPISLGEFSSPSCWEEFIHSCLLLFFEIYLFSYYYYFDCGGSTVAACGLAPVVASGGYSLLLCVGFSLQWLLLLPSTGSRRSGFRSGKCVGSLVAAHRL